jgi:prepilin-type processing-associated H-X9-DG protein
MDENLVGYLLNALEPDEQHAVEVALQECPETRNRLEALRQTIDHLAVDSERDDPPAGLWIRTLARVAEHRCRELPHAPTRLAFPPALGRSGWRRMDVAVAAGILLCLGLLIPPSLNYVRYRSDILACQNNLRVFHAALQDYSQRHHGDFPNVAAAVPEPRNVAGIFIPILNEEKLLPETVSVSCPAGGRQSPAQASLEDVKRMDMDEFSRYVSSLAGCYAYTLGYSDSDGAPVRGLRLEPILGNSAYVPILADRPPEQIENGDPGNSPNHGGNGQNVLYVDGHCNFCTVRTVGYNGDDIFVNLDKRVAAGKSLWDAVLASSAARP